MLEPAIDAVRQRAPNKLFGTQVMDNARFLDRRIKGFDGIRGLAAFAVFVQHALPSPYHLGNLGVYVFFVLSGFLIIGILRKGRLAIETGRSEFVPELIGFWIARAVRIFPVYYLGLSVRPESSCVISGR